MILSITALGIMILSIMALNITTLFRMTLSIVTFTFKNRSKFTTKSYSVSIYHQFTVCLNLPTDQNWIQIYLNRTSCIRQECMNTTTLSCHRCLINTGVETMNNI
jgi:hypothetical protein